MRSHALSVITEVCKGVKIIIHLTFPLKKKEQKAFIKSARRVPSLTAGRAEPQEGGEFEHRGPTSMWQQAGYLELLALQVGSGCFLTHWKTEFSPSRNEDLMLLDIQLLSHDGRFVH